MRVERTQAFLDGFRAINDRRAQAAIAVRLDRMAMGNLGDVASVGGPISELRVHVGAGWRVYFTRRGEDLVILLCVGAKATQDKDIEKARRLAASLSVTESKS